MEIITGLWLGQVKQIDNLEWCQEKKSKIYIKL
jgi:hypothetical protein